MAYLQTATTAFPEHLISQKDVAETMSLLLGEGSGNIPVIHGLFENARVVERRLFRPLPWYGQPHPLSERNRIYINEGLPLLAEACSNCLETSDCPPHQLDHIITVSSTGLASPSLDALLIDALGLPTGITRVPTWGLGCAGGVMAMGMAIDHLRAYPGHNVLIAALETCSLTFQLEDTSRKNLVGTALFGDGAGAALVTGQSGLGKAPRLLDHTQHHFPGTEKIMGWDIVDSGFQLMLSAELPELVRSQTRKLVDRFLEQHQLAITDLEHLLLHPGGPKVLDAVLEGLGVDQNKAVLAEKVLAESGNLSSVSILAIIQKWIEAGQHKQPGPGLMVAFGPGFTCTMVLFEA